MNELVERLTRKDNKVAAERSKNAAELKEQIDRSFVLIKFIETKGGTELGYKLDSDLTDLNGADFDQETGKVLLVGELTLNYDRVRCFATIDLSTLKGEGYLEPIAEQESVEAEEASTPA